MGTFAYVARRPLPASGATPPAGWPESWRDDWPRTLWANNQSGSPWPDDWPLDKPDLEIVTTAPTTITVGSAATVVSTIQNYSDSSDTDELDLHYLAVWAVMEGSYVQVKRYASDDYVNFLYYYVNNYTGTSYGISTDVLFDLDSGDEDNTVLVYCWPLSVNIGHYDDYSVQATVAV